MSPLTAPTSPAVPASLADYVLFTPLHLGGDLTLANRIVHAPVTRARSQSDRSPSELNAQYYEQRASAGLIITEATAVSEQGFGWFGAPALYTDSHEAGWRRVVDRVHARGGKIFLQMWHMGRQAHSSFNEQREIVSSSSTRYIDGRTRDAKGERTSYETARPLTIEEIPAIVEAFRQCAERAKRAGFDGVEIHGAGGYLLDQFLQRGTNQRTDAYGGSTANRARLLLEVVAAVETVLPSYRIGVRLVPNRTFGGMGTEENSDVFEYAMAALASHKLAYLGTLDGDGWGLTTKSRHFSAGEIKQLVKGRVLTGFGYDRDSAEAKLRAGEADLVAFARGFMTNPDLVERFRNDKPLRPEPEYKYYYDAAMGAEGYTVLPNDSTDKP